MDEEFDFRESWNILKNNAILAISIFVVILAVALVYTFTAPKVYEARSLVMITRQDQTSMLLGTQLNAVDMETQKEIVLSGSVIWPVYQKFNGQYFVVNAQTKKNSNVLEIIVESKDPSVSMNVANEVASSYINFMRDSKKLEASEVNDFISEQLVAYKNELDVLNLQLGNFKNVSNLTGIEKNIYSTLQREIAAKSKLYDYLLSRREETSIAAKEKSSNVKIIQYAYMPYAPIKPNIPMNIVLGFVLAMIIAIGAVFLKSQVKNAVSGSKEVEAQFGPAIICSIPKMNKKDFKKLGEEKGVFSESILSLRTNLSFHLKENAMKVIAISSPQKGDGKSLIAANLALSLSHSGKRVLLVDTDFRDSSLNKVFGLSDSESGLSDALLNPSKISDYIKKTDHRNLFFLPTGELQNSPVELASSEGMKSIFSKLKGSAFEAVIVDTASLEHTESTLIGASSDGVVLIVAHGKTDRNKIMKANAILKKAKAVIIGVVLNFNR
jgi:capsular exopolysaccharide synthesis family protein